MSDAKNAKPVSSSNAPVEPDHQFQMTHERLRLRGGQPAQSGQRQRHQRIPHRDDIASAQGGSLEIVKAGKSGLLVPAGDPYALAGAIRRLMLDPALRRKVAEAGRRRASEEFSPERLLEKLDEALTRLLQDGPRTASDATRPAQ